MISYWIDTLVLKTEGNTYATLLHHPFLLKGKPTQCSRGSKKDFWRHCWGDSRQVKSRFDSQQRVISGAVASQDIPSTHHKPLSPALHYLPFASRFPLPHFTLSVLFALSLSILPLFLYSPLFARFLFACVLVCLLVFMASPLSSPLSHENEVLNFKQREGENLKDAWYRICNAQNRSTRKQSTSILLRNFYVGAIPWHRYVLDTITGGNFLGSHTFDSYML